MPVNVKWNQTAVTDIIMTDGIQKSEAQMAAIARTTFNFHKNTFLREFNEHQMSQEIKAGPGAKTSLFSWGSLFSFIGFQKDKKPIEELDDFFKKSFVPPLAGKGHGKVRKRSKGSLTAYYTAIGYRPDLKDIGGATRWPWTDTGSWALDIEKGNFLHYAYYIFGHFENNEASYSGRGLQSKKFQVRSDTPSKPTNGYLRTMLDKFDSRF